MIKYFFLFLVFLTTTTNAQKSLYGRVIDLQNGKPISGAQLISNELNEVAFSDQNGNFNIKQTDSIALLANGYRPEKIAINKQTFLIISLEQHPNELQKVVVTTFNMNKKNNRTTQQISIVPTNTILQGDRTNLAPILNTVPGVYMQTGALNTNRISIRGIGARNPFGTVGIRTFYDDIPLTDGNGASAIEDLELSSLSRIEIHKGPAASSFGAGLGGTILLIPHKTPLNTTEGNVTTTLGSFGLSRFLISAAHGGKKTSFNLVYGKTESDGYRENNNYKRRTLTSTATLVSNQKNTVRFAGSYIDLKAFIPSSLDFETYTNTPEKAAFTWQAAQGFEDSAFGIAGITWTHQYNNKMEQKTSVYTSYRTNYEPRPFNILSEKSFNTGIKSRLGGIALANKNLKWAIGGEVFFEKTSIQTFENLYQDFPENTGSVQGNPLNEFQEKRRFYNLFAEAQYQFSSLWTALMGVNSNQTSFLIEDKRTNIPVSNNGAFDFEMLFSPRIGLVYTPTSSISLFGNIAHGFNTPTTEETLLPEGVFNPDLQPETGWNFEIGSHMHGIQKRWAMDLSCYLLKVKNLLVNRRGLEDQFFATNAGKTNHLGLEFAFRYNWIQQEKITLDTDFNTSINRYLFREFIDLDANYNGNKLTGTPSEIVNITARIGYKKAFFGTIAYQYVGAIPVNDANTEFSSSYKLLNSTFRYTNNKLLKRFVLEMYGGIQNILDERYASQIQVNASGFGSALPRYYYPGNPRNFFGGINIKFSFKN